MQQTTALRLRGAGCGPSKPPVEPPPSQLPSDLRRTSTRNSSAGPNAKPYEPSWDGGVLFDSLFKLDIPGLPKEPQDHVLDGTGTLVSTRVKVANATPTARRRGDFDQAGFAAKLARSEEQQSGREQATKIFDFIDLDGDLVVTRDEWIAAFTNMSESDRRTLSPDGWRDGAPGATPGSAQAKSLGGW